MKFEKIIYKFYFLSFFFVRGVVYYNKEKSARMAAENDRRYFMRVKTVRLMAVLLCMSLLAGYSSAVSEPKREKADGTGCGEPVELETLEEEATALVASPIAALVDIPATAESALQHEATVLAEASAAAVPDLLTPEASGVLVKKNAKAVIDYSNTKDGYVMVKFTADTSKRLKVQVQGPKTTYTYNLDKGAWAVFPLTDGNGKYQIKVFENVADTRYAMVLSMEQTMTLENEFAPFLRPNQYVDYSASSKAVAKAWELTHGCTDSLKKVAAVYDFVVNNLSYDKEKATTVKSGYLPVLDTVLETKKGICFDYAALMTGMLRSLGIPCKLVIGYAGTAYHAWIDVWTEETGWVHGAIFFNGTAWQRMDPTFASTGKQSAAIMAYIGNEKNYTAKYLY